MIESCFDPVPQYDPTSDLKNIAEIDEELAALEIKIEETQLALIDSLEQPNAKLANVQALEESYNKAIERRDELKGTREYMVERRRIRLEQDNNYLSYLIYLARWNPEHLVSSEVGHYIVTLTAVNEARGITGVLYVMRGWFAGYCEGDRDTLFEHLRIMKNDKRFDTVITVAREQFPKGSLRRYPKDSLKVVHFESKDNSDMPEGMILRQLSSVLNLYDYIPVFNRANRGPNRGGDRNDGDATLTDLIARGQDESSFPSPPRYLITVAPYGDLWESGFTEDEVSDTLRLVYNATRHDLMLPQTDLFRAGMVGPHTSDCLTVVIESIDGATVLARAVELHRLLSKNIQIRKIYKPIVCLHYSDEVGLIMNGNCTIVGSSVRYLRKMTRLARQEGWPLLFSYHAADNGDRKGCRSVGTYLIDREPSEFFVHETTEGLKYTAEAEARRASQLELQRQIDTHVEGPGPLAPEETIKQGSHLEARALRATRQIQWDKPVTFFHLDGFKNDRDLQAEYDKLEKDPDTGLVAREVFDAYYHGLDKMGVPFTQYDLLQLIGPSANPDVITFEQFCMIMHRLQSQ